MDGEGNPVAGRNWGKGFRGSVMRSYTMYGQKKKKKEKFKERRNETKYKTKKKEEEKKNTANLSLCTHPLPRLAWVYEDGCPPAYTYIKKVMQIQRGVYYNTGPFGIITNFVGKMPSCGTMLA